MRSDYLIYFDLEAPNREWLKNGGKRLFLSLFKSYHWDLFISRNYDLREIIIEADAETAERFESRAREITGWNTGLPYAPNPVIIARNNKI